MTARNLREQIIGIVASSGFAKLDMSPERLERTARAIGVCTDVLMEAQLRRMEMPSGKHDRKVTMKDAAALMPASVKEMWREFCGKRNAKGAVMIRTIIHFYLTSTYEPEVKSQHWIVHGKHYQSRPEDKGIYEKYVLTPGAYQALVLRANARNIKVAVMVRALITEAMEGKILRQGTYDLLRNITLSDSVDTYVLPLTASGKPRTFDSEEPARPARPGVLTERTEPLSGVESD